MNEVIKTLTDFVKIESVKSDPQENAPFGLKIREALDFILNAAQSFGLKTNDLGGYAGEIEYGSGEEVIGILAHADVVPLGEGWTRAQGEVFENRIYGRGTVDDKGPIVAVLYALKQIKDEGIKLNKTLRLIIGCDEESGCECMKYYQKLGRMPETGFSPDADFPLIICEKTIFHVKAFLPLDNFWQNNILELKGGLRPNMVPAQAQIKIKKSALPPYYSELVQKYQAKTSEDDETITLKFSGVSAHGSTPREGKNAIWKVFGFLVDAGAWGVTKSIKHYLLNENACKNMGIYIDDGQRSGDQTLNVGTANYNKDYNTLELTLDFRCPIPQKPQNILNRLNDLFKGARFEVSHHQPYLYADPESFLVKTLLASYEKVMGTMGAKGIITGGGTYARYLRSGVAFGPTFEGENPRIHNADESISIDSLKKLIEIYKEAMINLAK
ncbi:MAG TPA: M20 family metallopeptidase [Clostridiales bacterium]|nr:M20 family metallopeptidase [Clostridiales bacterium]